MRRILICLCTLGLTFLALGGCARPQQGAVPPADQSPPAMGQPAPPAEQTIPSSGANQPTSPAGQSVQLLTPAQAQQAALNHAGLTGNQVTFVQCRLDWEDKTQIYEIEFYGADGAEYDYEIDASTGAVVKFDYGVLDRSSVPATPADSMISEEQARDLVLARVPGAAAGDIRQFKLDYDDGRAEYEGEIIYNGMEYEFELDAYSGEIRDWDTEPIGH